MKAQNDFLSENEFSQFFSEKLVERVENLKIIKIQNLEIETEFNGEKGIQHFLDNAYSEYKRSIDELDEIVNRYIDGTQAMYLPKDQMSVANILPVIKDYRYLQNINQLRTNTETTLLYEKYNEDLYIFYVEDSKTSINYLLDEDLNNLNLGFEELREIAIQNLKNFSNIERHGEDGYYMLVADGNYEASLILLDIWDKENFQIKGDIVIGIPARDLLLISGSEDEENKQNLIRTIKDINETGNHIVSDKLFILKNGKFEVEPTVDGNGFAEICYN